MAKAHQHIRGIGAIRKRELIPFTRQMAGMMNAGLPILTCISTLEDQCHHQGFRTVLRSLRDVIESGTPFSEGLAMYPRIFDSMYVNMVAAGEESGQFALVMKRLAAMLDASARLVRKVKSALTYPVVILCLALVISFGLITFIVPVFSDMFEDFGEQLPLPTRVLVAISNFMKANWYFILPVVVFLVLWFFKWKKSARGSYLFDRFILKLPVFGPLVQKVAIARFSRLFAQMLTSGVPILDALQIVAQAIGNKVIEQSLLSARDGVEAGDTLSSSLEGKPFLPLLMVRMIAAGEKSGRIDEMLESVADTYDDEVEAMLATLTALMEPFLMVFLGIVIGGIVVAMFLPIFQMSTIVS
ncbi:MAG: type II secretion system F family protein [Kiritimatiellia bacterium]|jgi:type IV pilus assembly protein PilC